MKKLYTFLALLLLSGVIFAQTQRINGDFTSVKSIKGINSLHVSQTKAVTDSLHYDGDNNSSIGTGGATSFGVYAFFPATILAPQATAGHYILSEKLYINGVTNVTSAELRFYTDTLATAMVYSQSFTPVDGWNDVTLASPLLVPATGNLYCGYFLTVTGGYPAGCDSIGSLTYPDGNWIDIGSWAHLSSLSATLLGNWNIRVMCGTLPTTPTPFCNPLSWVAGNVPVPTSVTSGTFTLSNIGSDTLFCTGITGLSAPFTTTLVPLADSLLTGETTTFTFTFNPTVAGPINQTVVLATNGGNITINLSGIGTTCGTPISTFPWEESFEGVFTPSCWTTASPDGGTGWDQIASGTTPLPGWGGGIMTTPTGGGTSTAYCTWNTGGASANDQWLITPKIAVQANQDLTFYMYFFGAYADAIDVKVSTTTNATTSFTTTLLSIDTLQLIQDGWKQFTVHLSAYAGQNVYFAFNEHVADNVNEGAFIGLDLVRIDAASTNPMAQCTPLAYAAGDVPITTTVTSGTFTLKNDGQGTLTCSGITGISAPFTTTLVPASVSLAAGATTTFTFSYNPTVVGANNQTVVIATNGGDITITLSGTGTNCGGAISTFPWEESFEGTFPPNCWTSLSPDGGTGWAQIASGTTPIPGFGGGTMSVPTGGGTNAAYCTYTTGGASSNDQWLVTPKIAVQANQDLTFYIYRFGVYQDNVDIKVSTTTPVVASFTTTLLSLDTTQLPGDTWTAKTIHLNSYASQSVYFAFNEHVADNNADGAFIGLDLVKVDAATGINEAKEDLVSIFPNPVNDKLYIAADHVKSVEIFNIVGTQVASYGNLHIINVSDLSVGSYIVKVVTDSKVITRKINITR